MTQDDRNPPQQPAPQLQQVQGQSASAERQDEQDHQALALCRLPATGTQEMRPGTYKRSSVRMHHKALIWFSANPDEWLTIQDIKDKWGGSLDTINSGLRYACDAGLLKRTRHPDDTSANGRRTRYEAGPAIRLVLGLPLNDEEP